MKRCSMSLIIREMQIKTTVNIILYLSECHHKQINKQVVPRMWRKGDPFALLVGMQPLWKAVWRYLRTLKMDLPFWPSDPTSGNISEGTQNTNSKEHKHTIVALFTISKIWKQPKCPSVNEWIKQLWDIYIMEYYAAVKKKKIWPFATVWMDLY